MNPENRSSPAPSATPLAAPAAQAAAAVTHYENFPVASLLCPPRLRPPIRAIYAFARTADDIADEGDAPPAQRLQDLAQTRCGMGHEGADLGRGRARIGVHQVNG